MPAVTSLVLGGLALAAAGTAGSVYSASQQGDIEGNIAGAQMKIEEQKEQAMKLQAERQRMEVFRNAQRAHSLALTNATQQGAGAGSGLQGGFGQIAGAANSNILGINQNEEIGQNIFGYNQQISQYQMQLASMKGMQAGFQGLTSLGGAMVSGAGIINGAASGFGGGSYLGKSTSMGLQPYGSSATGSFY